MTISANDRRKNYKGNGVATSFTGPRCFSAQHVAVYIGTGGHSTLVPSSQYTVKGAGGAGSSTIIFNTPPADGVDVLILRTVPFDQPTNITNQGAFLPELHEDSFDYRTMQVQQLADRQLLTIRFPEDYPGELPDLEMPPPEPGKGIGWNADGTGIRYITLEGAGDLTLRDDLADPTAGANLVAVRRADGTTVSLAETIREKLSGPRTYYVRTNGNDNNNGLANTAGGAFATIQRAVFIVMETLDLNGQAVTIQVGDGTYNAGAVISGKWHGGDQVYILGNIANPAAVTISGAGDLFYAEKGASVDIRGFRLTSSGGRGLTAFSGAFIAVGPMEFGQHTGAAHVEIGTEGTIVLNDNYSVTGGGSSHLHAGGEGQIRAGTITVTITGTPNFSAYFCGAAQGSIVVPGVTFTGAATGARYLAHKNGTIETHPAFSPALPGDVEGRTAWGGAYIGSNAEPFRVQVFPGSAAATVFQAFDGATQLFRTILSLVTDPSGTGRGYLFCNGPGSYMSELCHFGTDEQVLMGNTVDGISTSKGGETSHSVTDKVAKYTRRQGSAGMVEQFWHGAVASGSITVNNGTTGFVTTSDEDLKDFRNPNYQPDWILSVGPLVKDYTFNHLPEGAYNPVRKGLPAQKLYAFSPNAVCVGNGTPGEEDYIPWGIDHSQLVPELLQEVYAQRQRIDELTALVASLVGKEG